MTTLKLMILTFTFYKIGDKISANNYQDFENSESFEKDFLQNVTKEHPIWNITEFWEAAIFCSIREEFKNQKKYLLGLEESREDASFRERNIVFGQLASYCNNMLMFHIDKTTVKDIIGNFCKIFSLLDTQIKDLNVK